VSASRRKGQTSAITPHLEATPRSDPGTGTAEAQRAKVMKPWIFYLIIAWQPVPGPLIREEQKTITLEFDAQSECLSIAEQIETLLKRHAPQVRIRQMSCLACAQLYDNAKCTKK
jgi:hypothetical protein